MAWIKTDKVKKASQKKSKGARKKRKARTKRMKVKVTEIGRWSKSEYETDSKH